MFQKLGNLVVRGRFFFLVAWLAALATAWYFAPPWSEVARDQEFGFLPSDAPSRQAEAVFEKAFPGSRSPSNIVIVCSRSDEKLKDEDKNFIGAVLAPGLTKIADEEGGLTSEPSGDSNDDDLFSDKPAAAKPIKPKSIIARIRTPGTPGAGALLQNQDGEAALVVMELTTDFLSHNNWPTMSRVEALLAQIRDKRQVPPGLDLSLTGSAIIGRDHTIAQLQSARATDRWTLILVVGLLILIYRAPLLAVFPLVTVFLAVRLSLWLLAIAAGKGYLSLFEGIQIYITVVTYGAGVDYCLFLTSRYKEELDAGTDIRTALANAIGKSGPALLASAGTVICGLGMMAFADFGKFQQAGLTMPVSLIVVLIATLTFCSALLSVAGRWAFWPHLPRRGETEPAPAIPSSLWRRLLGGTELTWLWERVGQVLMRRPGLVWGGSVLAMLPFALLAVAFTNRQNYDVVSNLPPDSPSVAGTRVLQEHFPAGIMGPLTVLIVAPNVDFHSEEGRKAVDALTQRLIDERDELGIADARSLTKPLGINIDPEHIFTSYDIPPEAVKQGVQELATNRYTSSLGQRHYIATRLEILFKDNPYAYSSIASLPKLEEAVKNALPPALQSNTQTYFLGATASMYDLEQVTQHDLKKIEILVLAGVFVILVLVLRLLTVSLYLIVSVLFSYYATLGVTIALFWLMCPGHFSGLDWKVGIFLFTILIAVGEDYNIFLMTRVAEEQRRHGAVAGILAALTRTGPIISSCGIIMAGTFASLMTGSLLEMKQLGFALAFGVILDTFVVRPILVPAFMILIHRDKPVGANHGAQ